MTDHVERNLAQDCAYSVIVRAPAGSGKTELLVRRYFHSLLLVDRVDQSLVLTFTQKAATELQNRIRNLLEHPERAKNPEMRELVHSVLTRSQHLGWNLERFPEMMQLMTIDSYFLKLFQLFCQEAPDGITPYVTDLDRMVEKMVEDFLEYVFATDPELQEIGAPLKFLFEAAYWNAAQVKRALIQAFECRDRWLAVQKQPGISDWTDFFRDELQQCEKILSSYGDDISTWFSYLEQYGCPRFRDLSLLQKYRKISQLLCTQKGEWRKTFRSDQGIVPEKKLHPWHTHHDRESMIGLMKDLQERFAQIPAMTSFLILIQNICFEDSQMKKTDSEDDLTPVMKILLAWNQIWKKEQKVSDFNDITARIAEILEYSHELRPIIEAYLAQHVRYLFVDESQDLSFSQAQICLKFIEIILENQGTFFFVGDPQQAIYAFRGSDIGIFQIFEQLANAERKIVLATLHRNFRSQPRLIDFVNQYCSTVFGPIPSTALGIDSAVHAVPGKDHHHQGLYELCSYSHAEQEAYAIAHEISQYSQVQRTQPWTIAVLGRDRKTLSPIRKWLSLLKVPYSAAELETLAQQQLFLDLLAFLQIMIEPHVKSHWLPFLRSRWIRATFPAIESVYQLSGSLWTLCLEGLIQDAFLSADLFVFAKKYQDFSPYFHRNSLYDAMYRLVHATELLKTFSAQEQILARQVLHQLREWQWGMQYPWQDFITWAEKTPIHKSDQQSSLCSVTLLTIHKAKGLEFDHVYLPNLGAKLPPKERPVWTFARSGMRVVHASCYQDPEIFDGLLLLDRSQADYEISRLLYVALTRAKNRLTCSFHQEQNDSRSFLNRIAQLFDEEIDRSELQLPQIYPESLQRKCPIVVDHQTFDHQLISWNNDPIEDLNPSRGGEWMTVIGLIIHDIFARATAWPIDYQGWTYAYWEQLWRAFGGSEHDQKKAFEWWMPCFIRLIHCSFLKESVFTDRHLHVWSEWTCWVMKKNGTLRRVRIDRCMQISQNEYWILDWKTTEQCLSPEYISDTYIQLKMYQQTIANSTGGLVKVGLYICETQRYVSEEELQQKYHEIDL